eukprot:scaffold287_cov337-Pavlova_lutheri.AAC.74
MKHKRARAFPSTAEAIPSVHTPAFGEHIGSVRRTHLQLRKRTDLSSARDRLPGAKYPKGAPNQSQLAQTNVM